MRIATRAARDHNAQSRILAAANKLAEHFGLTLNEEVFKALQAKRGDVATKAMLEREAIADLLEGLAYMAEPSKVPEPPEMENEPDQPPASEIAPEPEQATAAVVVEAPAEVEEPAKKPRGRKAKS